MKKDRTLANHNFYTEKFCCCLTFLGKICTNWYFWENILPKIYAKSINTFWNHFPERQKNRRQLKYHKTFDKLMCNFRYFLWISLVLKLLKLQFCAILRSVSWIAKIKNLSYLAILIYFFGFGVSIFLTSDLCWENLIFINASRTAFT